MRKTSSNYRTHAFEIHLSSLWSFWMDISLHFVQIICYGSKFYNYWIINVRTPGKTRSNCCSSSIVCLDLSIPFVVALGLTDVWVCLASLILPLATLSIADKWILASTRINPNVCSADGSVAAASRSDSSLGPNF